MLKLGEAEKPEVLDLQYNPDERMVAATFASKPEMPQVVLIPIEQCSGIVPWPTDAELASAPEPRKPIQQHQPQPQPTVVVPQVQHSSTITPDEAKKIREEYKAKYGNKNHHALPISQPEALPQPAVIQPEDDPVEAKLAASKPKKKVKTKLRKKAKKKVEAKVEDEVAIDDDEDA